MNTYEHRIDRDLTKSRANNFLTRFDKYIIKRRCSILEFFFLFVQFRLNSAILKMTTHVHEATDLTVIHLYI